MYIIAGVGSVEIRREKQNSINLFEIEFRRKFHLQREYPKSSIDYET